MWLPCLLGALFWVADAWRRCLAAGSSDHRGGGARRLCRWCRSMIWMAAPLRHILDEVGGNKKWTWQWSDGLWFIVWGRLPCPDLPLTYTRDVGVKSPKHSQWGNFGGPFSSVYPRSMSYMRPWMLLAQKTALGGWTVCTIFSLRGCVHVRLCALKHLRCIYSCSEWIVVNFSFSFFPLCRQSFGLLWLWFFRLDTLSVSVSVDCVHSTLAEARCVLVVLCILLILHHEPIRLKTTFIERKKYFLFMATSWSFFGW